MLILYEILMIYTQSKYVYPRALFCVFEPKSSITIRYPTCAKSTSNSSLITHTRFWYL